MENHGAKRRLVFGMFCALWAVKLIFGFFDNLQRHVPTYPNAMRVSPYIGQFGFYIAIPLALVTSNLLMLGFSNRLPHWVGAIVVILQIIVMLIFLFLGGGGV